MNYPQLTQGASCFIPLPTGSESTGSTALIHACKCNVLDIDRGVQVPVVGRAAVRARPFPILQCQIGFPV
ncbi:MAG: hypothetical protein XE10_1318, partial [Methanoculleus marisnigri]